MVRHTQRPPALTFAGRAQRTRQSMLALLARPTLAPCVPAPVFSKICNPMRPSWFATPYVPTYAGRADHPHTGVTITRSRWRILESVPSGHEHQRNAPSPNEPRRSSTAIPVINRVITDFRGEPTSPARATPSRVTVPWYAMASSYRTALEGVRYLGHASCPT